MKGGKNMAKRNYVSPMIGFHTLQINASIANSCAETATFDLYGCPMTVPGFPFTIFTQANCETYGAGYEDMICYHVPVDGMNVFSS